MIEYDRLILAFHCIVANLIVLSLLHLKIDAIIGWCKSHRLQGNEAIKNITQLLFLLLLLLSIHTFVAVVVCVVLLSLSLCQSVRLSSVFFLPFHFNFFHTLRWYFAVCVYLLANICSKPWNWNMNLTLASVSLFLLPLPLPLFQPSLEICQLQQRQNAGYY